MDFLVTKPCDAIRHLDGIASEFATTSRCRISLPAIRTGPGGGGRFPSWKRGLEVLIEEEMEYQRLRGYIRVTAEAVELCEQCEGEGSIPVEDGIVDLRRLRRPHRHSSRVSSAAAA